MIEQLQEDEKLTEENYRIREVSQIIMNALREKEIRWSSDGMELIGDLKFTQDELRKGARTYGFARALPSLFSVNYLRT